MSTFADQSKNRNTKELRGSDSNESSTQNIIRESISKSRKIEVPGYKRHFGCIHNSNPLGTHFRVNDRSSLNTYELVAFKRPSFPFLTENF